MTALGEFPLGGFSLADSLSVGDPLSGLLTDPHAAREFLVRAEPLDDAGAGNPFDVSGDGYVSRSTDTPFKHFIPAIQRPGDFSVSLPTPALHGSTQTGIGAIVLNNPDGFIDAFLGYDWLGVDVGVYLGPKHGALSEFTRILNGPGAGIGKRLNDATILFRDTKFRLQRALQPRKYWGTGAALRLAGTGGISYGDVLDQGAGDSFTAEMLFRTSTFSGSYVFMSKTAAINTAANPGWAVWRWSGDADSIFINLSDGVDMVELAFDAADYYDGNLHRLSYVINRTSQRAFLYIDGTLINYTDVLGTLVPGTDITAVGSLANSTPMYVGRDGSGLFNFIGDVDDYRFWHGVARTQADIQADMHRELTGVETGLASGLYTKYNEGAGTTANDETVNNRDGTITNGTWIGSLEGDESIAGKPKPIAEGVRRQVAPRLVDNQNLVYQFNNGSMQAITALRDNGDPLTFGSNVSDIYASAPAAGSYNTSLAKGLVRLGSEPVGVITGDIEGDNQVSYENTAAGIGRKVLVNYGGMNTATEFDDPAFTTLESTDSSIVGFYWDEEVNIDVAAGEVFSSIWAWWGPERLGKITCGRIPDPATQTSTVTVTDDILLEPALGGKFESTSMSVRVGEVRVLFRPYHTTLNDDQVAGVVDLATRKDYGEKYRIAYAVDPNRSADSDIVELTTSIDNRADAQALADTILAILNVDRDKLSLVIEGGLLSYFIGTVVNVQVDRYTYANKNMVVVNLSEFYGDAQSPDRVEVDLFG